ncbi:MAG: hypothetical protein IT340_14230 [Chloroflexi bacterium]|nr:hypothetical protein [Chloroflexota bacterium]
MTLHLNDEPLRSLGAQTTFQRQAVPVQLRVGTNRLLLTLTNTKGTTWGAWCFACRVVAPDGRELVARVE